jgi:F0F1-type ATP synthase epsilon subunit
MSDDSDRVADVAAEAQVAKDSKQKDATVIKDKSGKNPTMHVKIYGPFKDYLDEDCYSISAVNYTGPFDVLPHHHKFITVLDPCDLVVQTPYETKRFRISRGVMHVREERVIVFLDV